MPGFGKRRLIGCGFELMPKLFFPWNPCNHAGEQPDFRVIHTVKKKIY